MAYNPATDFLGLWRNIAGVVSKTEMPGLDYVVAALARAGLITLSVSATAPVVSQSTTAWLQAAVPSYSAEGALQLWNPATSAYAAATPALFFEMLQASTGQNGVSWWTSAGGPPINTVGNNGDFAIRTDEPGGIYGPKAAGAWPANPLPGTTDIIGSAQLDLTFGSTEGALIYRGPTVWSALEIGAANTLLASSGTVPEWEGLSALLDAVFGTTQGSLLYRDVGLWEALAPGTAGFVLTAAGAGADPAWGSPAQTFPSGTVMLFQQATAPTGWTKQTVLNDYGLRVTSGTPGVTAGTAFSTVFAQTATGNTTISQATSPSHTHTLPALGQNTPVGGGSTAQPLINGAGTTTTSSIGSDGAHDHAVNLTLAYVDVIMAAKN